MVLMPIIYDKHLRGSQMDLVMVALPSRTKTQHKT